VEEGYTEMLPPQKGNIAKHYLQDQLAFAATVGGTQKESLVQELSSPSKWFQKRAAKEVGRVVEE
jgi:hypothetical protein